MFAGRLAEAHLGVAGFAGANLGEDENPAQTAGGRLNALLDATIDAALAAAALAIKIGLPRDVLPPAV